jgi:peptidyl-prolyl cis-trans isomerase C
MSSSTPSPLIRLARQPLLHFLVIGMVVGLLYDWRGERAPSRAATPDEPIRITAAEVSLLEAQWQARWKRPPTEDEFEGLIQGQVREAALFREAIAMGLDQGDPLLRRVLVQKLETIARDLVELSLAPTEQDLQAWFTTTAERYRPPALITFASVFVDPDRRGDQTLVDAAEMLTDLQALEDPMEGLEDFGDAFMLQRYYPEKPEARIGSLFGHEFARSVFELEAGRWHGPVLSGYGTHLVYVENLREFPVPDLGLVKERVTQDWVDEKRAEITEDYFAAIIDKYEVVIERESDTGTTLPE